MSDCVQAAVCILVDRDTPEEFARCLAGALEQVPAERVELRLAFGRATECFHWMLGTLCAEDDTPRCIRLPGGVERFDFYAQRGMRVWAWHAERYLSREQLGRLLYHGVSVEAEYVVCLEPAACIAAGWWEALARMFTKGIDLIGEPAWHPYRPGEADAMATADWYMGVPVARRQGTPGVTFMREGCFALRAERLREADYPAPGSGDRAAVRLGQMAHQLGWSVGELGENKMCAPSRKERKEESELGASAHGE
jgi:hypothetical protein